MRTNHNYEYDIECVNQKIQFGTLQLTKKYEHYFIRVRIVTDFKVRFGSKASVVKSKEFPTSVILLSKEVRFVLPENQTFLTFLINNECKGLCEEDLVKHIRLHLKC